MAADLYIHVLVDPGDREYIDEWLLHCFSGTNPDNPAADWMYGWYMAELPDGSKVRCTPFSVPDDAVDVREVYAKYSSDTIDAAVERTPRIWVGEVSWLKASLFEDSETFIPDLVAVVSELIPSTKLTIVTDEVIDKIREAFDLPNKTVKEDGVWNGAGYSLAEAEQIIQFLTKYKGQEAFTISW